MAMNSGALREGEGQRLNLWQDDAENTISCILVELHKKSAEKHGKHGRKKWKKEVDTGNAL